MALLAAIIAATMISSVSAHGYMAVPAPRNFLNAHAKGFYNEMSLDRYSAHNSTPRSPPGPNLRHTQGVWNVDPSLDRDVRPG